MTDTPDIPIPDKLRELAKQSGFEHGTETGRLCWGAAEALETAQRDLQYERARPAGKALGVRVWKARVEAAEAALAEREEAIRAALAILPTEREPHTDDGLQRMVNLAAGLLDGLGGDAPSPTREICKTALTVLCGIWAAGLEPLKTANMLRDVDIAIEGLRLIACPSGEAGPELRTLCPNCDADSMKEENPPPCDDPDCPFTQLEAPDEADEIREMLERPRCAVCRKYHAKGGCKMSPPPDRGERFEVAKLINVQGSNKWTVTLCGVVYLPGLQLEYQDAAQSLANVLSERERLRKALEEAIEKLMRETFHFEETPEYERWSAALQETNDGRANASPNAVHDLGGIPSTRSVGG